MALADWCLWVSAAMFAACAIVLAAISGVGPWGWGAMAGVWVAIVVWVLAALEREDA
jgi:hypothetical protein